MTETAPEKPRPSFRLLLLGNPKAGKCLGRGTLVMRADGTSVPVERITLGDKLAGPENSIRTVLSLSRGSTQLYRIQPLTRASWRCNADHILTLYYKSDYVDIPVWEFLKKPEEERSEYRLAYANHNPPDEFSLINPYFAFENFEVYQDQVEEYYGFTLDGNGRFLLSDGCVTHNSGSLASLLTDGWNLRYLDFDNNSEPLYNYSPKELHKNIHVVRCKDDFVIDTSGAGKIGLSGQTGVKSWATMFSALTKGWPTDGSNPREWDPAKNVLVLDSLSAMGEARLLGYQTMNPSTKNVWRLYQETQKDFTTLFSAFRDYPPCPIICITHLQLHGPDLDADEDLDDKTRERIIEAKLKATENVPWIWAPNLIGRAKAMNLPQVFNAVALVRETPLHGRVISTSTVQGFTSLAVPFPSIKGDLPIADGMAKIFREFRKSL